MIDIWVRAITIKSFGDYKSVIFNSIIQIEINRYIYIYIELASTTISKKQLIILLMELKYISSGGKASPKRSDHLIQSRLHRARNHQKNNLHNIQTRSNYLLDAIAKSNGVVSQTEEDGVVRMKIVVRKQDLKQMLQVMGGNNDHNTSSFSPSLTAEQRLSLLRKKHVLMRANLAKQSRRSCWSPVLQSIPEEF